jgi:thiazole synthase ThiGH ThiG subunit
MIDTPLIIAGKTYNSRLLVGSGKYKDLTETKLARIVADYNVDNVSDKVLKIIISYTDYINRTVWHK